MALNRIFTLLPSVLLLCQSCASDRAHASAHGYVLDLATVPSPDRARLCGDSRYIIAKAVGNRRVRLNANAAVSLDDFLLHIREINRYRAEKVVFVAGEGEASWTDFVEMVDQVWREADVVSMITPEVERFLYQHHCLILSCGQCGNHRSFHAR